MEADLRLVGGDLAIDLLNTLDQDLPGGDHLTSDADVAAWLGHVGLAGDATLADTRAVRAQLDAVLRPLATGSEPAPAALHALLALETDALAGATLTAAGLQWSDPLARITHAAFELVLHGRLDRLRQCANCTWLFLDLSRNASRRWCSMDDCGTQVKSRRLTDRRRNRRSHNRSA